MVFSVGNGLWQATPGVVKDGDYEVLLKMMGAQAT